MENVEHIEALRTKHAALEHELESELQRPHPDDGRVQQIKREKLKIKDEIAVLEHA